MYSSFFLGANSGHGFHSFYDELIDLTSASCVYILKGGPGSGKSSIMKKIAAVAVEKGYFVERIYCSSDPDSLDGIIIPDLGKAIVDGTSPHVVEPKYPLAVERYINLGEFADYSELSKQKDEIISVKNQYSGYFDNVYRLTSSAASIENELFDISLEGISIEKLHKKARAIISREILGTGCGKKSKNRFISAISPKGYITLSPDNESAYAHNYVIEDNFGLAHFLLAPILDAAKSASFECVACRNPLIPERLEHLIIPELSLSFMTISKEHPYVGKYYRKIRLDSMIDANLLRSKRQRIKQLRTAKNLILAEACDILGEAKLVHDELENLYNPHIKFEKLYEYADELIGEIF